MIAIVKPVGNYCNLRCSYCFYRGVSQHEMQPMSNEILRKFLTELREIAPKTVIIWHGGEPLLAGMCFYEKAFKIQAELWEAGSCANLTQTNGTLVTDEWTDFFKKNEFRVGVSLDGCPHQHNSHRKTAVGRGSHKATMRGIRTLQRNGVDFGIIQTVTKSTLGYVAESFDYLHKVVRAKSFALNVFQVLESDNPWIVAESVNDEEWGEYLKVTFSKWLEADDPELIIREVETIIQGAIGRKSRACRFNGSCGHYLCLEPDGKIYPCDRLMTSEYLWGNLREESLEEILSGSSRKRFLEENIRSYQNCEGCEWFGACHNGCGSHRVGGVSGKFYYCESMKRSFKRAQRALLENSLEGR